MGGELFPYGTDIIGKLKAIQSALRDTLISGPKNNDCLQIVGPSGCFL